MAKYIPPCADELMRRGIDPKTMQPIKKTALKGEAPVATKPGRKSKKTG